eukprot:Protomagalhaensia_sp_Gyna_25__1098@NODE_1536_length_1757_cov_579_362049_g1247_i0_p2_GENE_NODE_1536_length_1757_cov_579_362049_g1247_i0NODE_1536_length_1757_cov_579_362049_g1247_i0_p2_ORF_typecomplete_len117_score20_65Dynein_light/PF01221_18/6_3e27PEPutilisers_N/PF05524_13/0_1_NODE_1536_length_1757_cov_579_362049_g1247_i012401590
MGKADTMPAASGVVVGPEKSLNRSDVEVRNKDMSDEHLEAAIDLACEAVATFKTELEVAEFIKQNFDVRFGPKWHCVVGRHFASHVSYEPNHYVYLKVGREVILLFKSGGGGSTTV